MVMMSLRKMMIMKVLTYNSEQLLDKTLLHTLHCQIEEWYAKVRVRGVILLFTYFGMFALFTLSWSHIEIVYSQVYRDANGCIALLITPKHTHEIP